MSPTGSGGRRRAAPLRSPRRLAAVVGFLGLCAALPWVVPALPALLAGGFPGSSVNPPAEEESRYDAADRSDAAVAGTPAADPLVGVRLRTAGRPAEIRIPRLHLDSTVVPISGRSGTLEPPADPQQLGWWQEGPEAGAASGSAVVAGHSVHTGGGAFDRLGQLGAGDRIRVRTAAGWIGYRVERARTYSTGELARRSAEIFRRTGAGRLVLITCADWDGSRFASNAVVYAVPVSDEPEAVRTD